MSAKFVDTNVVVYLFSGDEPEKKSRAEAVTAEHTLLSTQVLNEFANVMFRKFKLTNDEVAAACRELSNNFTVSTVTSETIFHALKLKGRYGFSYFDSLIVASALEEGCDTLYTEDLQHGQIIEDQLTISNPFKH
jgi:predicted nucleic acid-binding protein